MKYKANGIETIGQVRISGLEPDNDFEVSIDIDAGRTIIAEVTSETNPQKRSYQLSNLYQIERGWWLDDELEKALQGYTVWPLRPITDPEPVPPGVLSAENASAHIQYIDRRITALTEDTPDLQRELVRRGMIYQLAGETSSAEADYLRAVDSPYGWVATTARWLASLLPQLSDRSRALDALQRAYERMEEGPELDVLPREIAIELRNAGEMALAASFDGLAEHTSIRRTRRGGKGATNAQTARPGSTPTDQSG